MTKQTLCMSLRPGPWCVPPLQPSDACLLSVTDLKVHFPIRKGLMKSVVGYVKAVDGVSLQISPGKDAGAGRRIRLRENNSREGHPATYSNHVG